VLLPLAAQSCTWRRRGHGGRDRVSSVRQAVLSALHDVLSGSRGEQDGVVSRRDQRRLSADATGQASCTSVYLAAPPSAWGGHGHASSHYKSILIPSTRRIDSGATSHDGFFNGIFLPLPFKLLNAGDLPPPHPHPCARKNLGDIDLAGTPRTPLKLEHSVVLSKKKPATRAFHPLTRLCRTACAQRRVGQIFLCAAGRL
jgi:hypothetical protein